jgi:hypothetical protein
MMVLHMFTPRVREEAIDLKLACRAGIVHSVCVWKSLTGLRPPVYSVCVWKSRRRVIPSTLCVRGGAND